MWQFGLVDTFTAVHFIYNAGAQYSAVVIAAIADGNVTKFPTMLFEPIAGFGVSYQFVKAAQNAAERRDRVATLAALLSASTATAVGSTPAANAGLGGAVAAHIAHMRDVLGIRGGSTLGSRVKDSKIVLDSVKLTVREIHPFRAEKLLSTTYFRSIQLVVTHKDCPKNVKRSHLLVYLQLLQLK